MSSSRIKKSFFFRVIIGYCVYCFGDPAELAALPEGSVILRREANGWRSDCLKAGGGVVGGCVAGGLVRRDFVFTPDVSKGFDCRKEGSEVILANAVPARNGISESGGQAGVVY